MEFKILFVNSFTLLKKLHCTVSWPNNRRTSKTTSRRTLQRLFKRLLTPTFSLLWSRCGKLVIKPSLTSRLCTMTLHWTLRTACHTSHQPYNRSIFNHYHYPQITLIIPFEIDMAKQAFVHFPLTVFIPSSRTRDSHLHHSRPPPDYLLAHPWQHPSLRDRLLYLNHSIGMNS